ncbi:MAG: aspartyl/asparaginyl beta-hydroxylase domain-containing protein [Acidimicrobiales bacterium]|nr:aspartyl/asparaginyl beta-hydroxylase domain-containing protein [Acidimicrobiales bacterium]
MAPEPVGGAGVRVYVPGVSGRRYLARSRHLLPVGPGSGGRLRRGVVALHGAVVLALFDLNDAVVSRWGGDPPAVWESGSLPWVRSLEEARAEIVREYRRFRAEGGLPPHVARIAGLEPGTTEATDAAPVDQGVWRVLILVANGRWVPETAERFPATVAALGACPQMTTVGFSVLEGHSHIADHADPNRGALRYQLPLVVPGDPGDCRIRVVDRVIEWREGESVLFDVNVMHEVWNDSDEDRVLLMVETAMPLRFPVSLLNRFVQHQYRYHPSHRGMAERVAALAREGAPAGVAGG